MREVADTLRMETTLVTRSFSPLGSTAQRRHCAGSHTMTILQDIQHSKSYRLIEIIESSPIRSIERLSLDSLNCQQRCSDRGFQNIDEGQHVDSLKRMIPVTKATGCIRETLGFATNIRSKKRKKQESDTLIASSFKELHVSQCMAPGDIWFQAHIHIRASHTYPEFVQTT